jgi:hypothetical protein
MMTLLGAGGGFFMAKLLVWVPVGGLSIIFGMLWYAMNRNAGAGSSPKPGPEKQLVLVLEDYEEQVEILVRWLQFRQRWLGVPVNLMLVVTASTGDTYKILERLHKDGSFQIIEGNGDFRHTDHHDTPVIKLEGECPIPWGELEQNLRQFRSLAS